MQTSNALVNSRYLYNIGGLLQQVSTDLWTQPSPCQRPPVLNMTCIDDLIFMWAKVAVESSQLCRLIAARRTSRRRHMAGAANELEEYLVWRASWPLFVCVCLFTVCSGSGAGLPAWLVQVRVWGWLLFPGSLATARVPLLQRLWDRDRVRASGRGKCPTSNHTDTTHQLLATRTKARLHIISKPTLAINPTSLCIFYKAPLNYHHLIFLILYLSDIACMSMLFFFTSSSLPSAWRS